MFVYGPWLWFREVGRADIELCEVLFTIREAVKLPLMWELWSRKDVKQAPEDNAAPRKPSRFWLCRDGVLVYGPCICGGVSTVRKVSHRDFQVSAHAVVVVWGEFPPHLVKVLLVLG